MDAALNTPKDPLANLLRSMSTPQTLDEFIAALPTEDHAPMSSLKISAHSSPEQEQNDVLSGLIGTPALPADPRDVLTSIYEKIGAVLGRKAQEITGQMTTAPMPKPMEGIVLSQDAGQTPAAATSPLDANGALQQAQEQLASYVQDQPPTLPTIAGTIQAWRRTPPPIPNQAQGGRLERGQC